LSLEKVIAMEKSKNRCIHELRIYKAQNYICAHLDQELNLEKLVKIFAVSPFYFHRMFKSIAGETLYGFIQRVRLEKSCSMLSSNHDMKIISIAMNSGFRTSSSFSKSFKQHFKISPSAYRSHFSFNNSKNGTSKSKTNKEVIPPIGYLSDLELESLYRRKKQMNVEIKKIPKYRVAYMRQIGPYGEKIFS